MSADVLMAYLLDLADQVSNKYPQEEMCIHYRYTFLEKNGYFNAYNTNPQDWKIGKRNSRTERGQTEKERNPASESGTVRLCTLSYLTIPNAKTHKTYPRF